MSFFNGLLLYWQNCCFLLSPLWDLRCGWKCFKWWWLGKFVFLAQSGLNDSGSNLAENISWKYAVCKITIKPQKLRNHFLMCTDFCHSKPFSNHHGSKRCDSRWSIFCFFTPRNGGHDPIWLQHILTKNGWQKKKHQRVDPTNESISTVKNLGHLFAPGGDLTWRFGGLSMQEMTCFSVNLLWATLCLKTSWKKPDVPILETTRKGIFLVIGQKKLAKMIIQFFPLFLSKQFLTDYDTSSLRVVFLLYLWPLDVLWNLLNLDMWTNSCF